MLDVFQRYGQLLGAYLAPRRGQVIALALLVGTGIGLQLLGPQLIRRFLDTALAGAAPAVYGLAAGLAILTLAVQRAAALAAVYAGERLGWQATNALRTDLALHTLRLDLDFHKRHTPGELIERLDSDVTALANFFTQFSVRLLGNALLIGGVLAVLWFEDWRISLALAGYVLLSLLGLAALQQIGTTRYATAIAAESATYGFLEERLGAGEDLRAAGAEPYTLQRFDDLQQQQMRTARRARLTGHLAASATEVLRACGYAAGLALGAWLFLRGEASLGTAYLVVAYVALLATPLEQIRVQAEDLQRAGASIARVTALQAATPQVREQPAAQLPPGPLSVAFDGVTFTYASDNGGPVLQGLSFELAPGQVLGLLGRTGSGKSTLARLLFRLYDPQAGVVRLGGVDLRDVALRELRSQVGMVTQEVQLFNASVRDNLTFFDPVISDAHLETALRSLGRWEWVCGLPQGLATVLSGTYGLSAGEAQLLAFARVLLKNPGLVILDEASARLDPATEQLLERAVDALFAQRTGIIIAHRLQTVQRADLILILDGGRIVEFGPRTALAADPQSHFARLLRNDAREVLV